jgi:hypothetical protein
MDTEPTITLFCVRKDGRRERTKISEHTMSDARELAKWLLYSGNGLYTAVDICTEDWNVRDDSECWGAISGRDSLNRIAVRVAITALRALRVARAGLGSMEAQAAARSEEQGIPTLADKRLR